MRGSRRYFQKKQIPAPTIAQCAGCKFTKGCQSGHCNHSEKNARTKTPDPPLSEKDKQKKEIQKACRKIKI